MAESETILNQAQLEQTEKYFKSMKPFLDLMVYNRCALMEIETKLKVLNEEFSTQYQRNPIETIKTRIKSPMSILEKLNRKGLPLTIESMENHLNDIAGVRVICSFPDDIYTVSSLLAMQDDIRVTEVRDYIRCPKPNGYRSLHQILEIPIYLSSDKRYMHVEVQYRTIAMDFWASLDHKMKYKKHVENMDFITNELRHCADVITATDLRMQEIRKMIDSGSTPKLPCSEELDTGMEGAAVEGTAVELESSDLSPSGDSPDFSELLAAFQAAAASDVTDSADYVHTMKTVETATILDLMEYTINKP